MPTRQAAATRAISASNLTTCPKLITCCSVLGPKQKHFNMRFRKCTSIRVGKECQYSHTPQEEPTKVPREEEMRQANELEEEFEATASELEAATKTLDEKKQLASEGASARARTPPFARAQVACDAVAKAKREKKKAEQAANAGVANSGVEQPKMVNIGQVRENEVLASEREANALVAYYATANPEE